MGSRSQRPVAWALGALVLWTVLYEVNVLVGAVAPHGLLAGRPAHLVVEYGAGLLCLLGAARHRGAVRVAWLLIGLGIVAWTSGDTYWTAVLLDEESIPVPSPADVGYLLFPLLTFAGLTLLLRARAASTSRRLVVDSLSATLATAAVAAAVVVPAVSTGGDWRSVATNVAYPLTDLILLGVVVAGTALGGWRPGRVLALAGAGAVSFWAADASYLLKIADGSYAFPDAFDVLWTVAFLLLAAAAWQPPERSPVAAPAGRRTALAPLLFAATGLGVLVWAGVHDVTPVAVALATASLVVVGVRLWMTFRENVAMLDHSRREALTDALTGLGNRRALIADLHAGVQEATGADPLVLVLLDLDGFKHYNDSFGHPAGDTLLTRLGRNLARRVAGEGRAYRMGGDEFCVLLRPARDRAVEEAAADVAAALAERGEGFAIASSHGAVVVPLDTDDPEQALRLADQRMYARKQGGRPSAGRQSRDVLLRALAERNPELGDHVRTVADLATAVARRLGLGDAEVEQVAHAAELHDVGKVAIPDAILAKQGPLDDAEAEFMRRHAVIGERIVAAAPALREVAVLVRASHERWDGAGYPDGLAGAAIPLGARIVAVCDAFDAMTTTRAYRAPVGDEAALAELRRCGGVQFDPAVVEAFCAAYAELAAAPDGRVRDAA
jgi:diguanylate cyclase (GGDEF)-like protein